MNTETVKPIKSIVDYVELKHTRPEFARIIRNAARNKAREMASPAAVIGIPAMLKKQAF